MARQSLTTAPLRGGLLALLCLLLVACTEAAATGSRPAGIVCTEAAVSRVVDGDTIDVSLSGFGATSRVRYIGVNTPETVDPRRPVEPLGKQASEANRRLVEGQRVCLEKDVSETDQYGRLLRYVWLGDRLVNLELVREGYAQSVSYPPDVKYQPALQAAQREAREASRGLWALPPTPTVRR